MDREQLVKLTNDSDSKIEYLKTIEYDGLKEHITELESVFKEFKEGGEELLSQDNILQIGIVGQVKAGKSSFLNSLFFDGEDVLPRASTPMTAGLTVMEYSEKNTFEVEYFNEKDWEIFVNQDEDYKKREREVRENNPNVPENIIKKEIEARTSDKIRSAHEMVSSCSPKARQKIGQKNDVEEFYDSRDLQNVLEQYVGANGEYTSVVKSLYIKKNDERLKGLRIVDTPGVNDPVVSRENRTRTFLHSCHGVFLLSASTDFLGSGDIGFLNSRIGGSGIGTVVLLASKFDSVLQDIGAEREMKGEERGDLADTAEMQTKKFKRRLREQEETINENLRGKIKLDTTAGIGYSIAKKPADKWDNVEKQVVQQMKRYYPDYFSTENEIIESFEGLANISDIKEKYLEGVFMENKDAIISEKVKGFFAKNRQEISTTIDHILDEFKNRQEQLNETTIAEIQKQKEMQRKLFDGLKSTFASIFNNFSRNIQNEVKHIANNVRFNEIRTIPTEQTTEAITCKGWLWGHNTNEMTIDHVNTYALCSLIDDAVESYGKAWNDEWQKLFNNARHEMYDKLCNAICDFEKEVMSSSFNDSYYRELIDRALDELRDNRELGIGDIITKYQRQGDDIANKQYYPSDDTKELEEKQVLPFLAKCLREHNSNLVSEFRILADSLKLDVETEIKKNLNNSIKVIEGMKTSFADKLKEEGETYLISLEKDMTEKTTVLKKIDSIIACVTELATLYR